MSVQWRSSPTAQEAAESCGGYILATLEATLAAHGTATVAFSGGSTPKLMFDYLAGAGFDWLRVHVFWVDERAVPPEHQDSNFRLTNEHLIQPAKIAQANVHRIRAELPPENAALRYEAEIRSVFGTAAGEIPQFDVIHLGMGPDGHTASLFPGEALIANRDRVAAAVWVDKLKTHRITLLPAVLLAARNTAVLVAGQDKAATLRTVFHDSYDPLQHPAQLIAQGTPAAIWYIDEAAASLLENQP